MAPYDLGHRLADGRVLGYAEWGDPRGAPVFYFHGTPASRLDPVCFPDAPAQAGVRLISVDRPGMGLSSFQRGRRIADWPDDVAALADALGIDRFGVVGWSGGGPYVLACAWRLADRLTGAASAAGIGRMDGPGAAADLHSIDRLGYRLARYAPAAGRALFGAMFAACRRSPERALQGFRNDVSEPDQAVIDALPDEAKAMGWFIESGRQGGRGPTHDYRALHDWGFPLGDVTAPVELWQGDADVLVPMAHAEDLAAVVPGATLRRCPGEGHLVMATHATELLTTAAGQRR